ncbi:hypothetical protein OC844_006676, partial [Tilletia horrida]
MSLPRSNGVALPHPEGGFTSAAFVLEDELEDMSNDSDGDDRQPVRPRLPPNAPPIGVLLSRLGLTEDDLPNYDPRYEYTSEWAWYALNA